MVLITSLDDWKFSFFVLVLGTHLEQVFRRYLRPFIAVLVPCVLGKP